MATLLAILYRSEALTLSGGSAERDFLTISRRNNATVDVTGFLHRESGVYFQWLEGPEAEVLRTFERIARDDRHGEIEVLERREIAAREFPTWTMGYGNSTDVSLFDWAAEHDAPLHPPRPADILAFMQEIAERKES